MALRALVVRGLPKEVEEELNKFLTTRPVSVVHMTQSETADHLSITLLYEEPEPL